MVTGPSSAARQVLVTGATGFVGAALTKRLVRLPGHRVAVAVRQHSRRLDCEQATGFVASLSPDFDWSDSLAGVDTVYHLAARVHLVHDTSSDPLAAYRTINVEGTLNLARQAAAAGVRRFVFVSSIKVNGEATAPSRPFTAGDVAAPADAYGLSKMEAEAALARLCGQGGLELVVVRPPLVYGPGVKANFLRMMNWIDRGIPLPFGAIDNRRSLVALDNLVDLLVTCGSHPAAANQVFLAGDGDDVSTPELLRRLGEALQVRVRLVAVPVPLLRAALRLSGRSDIAQRLCSSLQVDVAKARDVLGWKPPVGMKDALAHLASDYRQHKPKA